MQYYSTEPAKATAYLKGLAGFCSYNTWSSFIGTTNSYTKKLDEEATKIKSDRPEVMWLGRMRDVGEDADPVRDSLAATTMTLAHVTGSGTSGDSTMDCLGMMRTVFVDEVEQARFDATISRTLYDRLQPLVLATRVGVGVAAHTAPISTVLNNATLFAQRAAASGIRIVGAPRGSWAGLARPLPSGEISSSEGMFVMIMKQAKASFLDSVINIALDGTTSPCDHAPFSAQTTWNACVYSGFKLLPFNTCH